MAAKENNVRRTAFDEDGDEFLSVLSRDDGEKEANEKTRVRNQRADEERSDVDQLENVNVRVDTEGQNVKNKKNC